MQPCYSYTDSEFRSYHGWQFDESESNKLLKTSIKDILSDAEEKDSFVLELQDLAGLPATGFDNARVLLDIQDIVKEDPQDLRNWRIGEAFAEAALNNHLSARFHWNELRDARNPKGNKTGADLVGFVEVKDCVLFLFGEVKTSSETKNRPPQVMNSSADCIENQLKALYSESNKRMILIRYLANKVRSLNSSNPFKIDYEKAKKTYYLNNHPNYQLIGVLMRDVEPNEEDIKKSYLTLVSHVKGITGIKLIACYLPISKEKWKTIIESDSEQ